MKDDNEKNDIVTEILAISFLVQIGMIILKLVKAINVSWWIVLIPFLAYVGFAAFCAIIVIIVILFDKNA